MRGYKRPNSIKFTYAVSYEDEADIVVEFDCNYYFGRDAKINAEPEDCYPAEPAEYDLDNPMVDLGNGKTRKLTAEELKKLGCETEQALVDKIMEEQPDDVHDQAATEAEKYAYPD